MDAPGTRYDPGRRNEYLVYHYDYESQSEHLVHLLRSLAAKRARGFRLRYSQQG
jgi:hypothetical protein